MDGTSSAGGGRCLNGEADRLGRVEAGVVCWWWLGEGRHPPLVNGGGALVPASTGGGGCGRVSPTPPSPLFPPRARRHRPARPCDARQPPPPDRDGSAPPPRGRPTGSSGPPRGRASVPADTGNRGMASEAGGTHARASGGRPLPRRASPAQLTRPPQTHFLHFSDGEWRWGARVGVAVRCSRMLRWAMTAAAGGHAAGAAGVAVADGRASVEPTRLVTDGRREGVGKGGEILP